MSIYGIMINIIDKIRSEAPSNMTSYNPNPDELEKIINARSKTLIHLFLKASFGIVDFLKRESFITDGTNDGGIDGYYIDSEQKVIYFIQAKFRATEQNFLEKEISVDEILKMDIDRILQGETQYENGNPYNSKIIELQEKIKAIPDIGRYKYQVVFIANLWRVSRERIQRLVSGFPFLIYDYKRIFSELVFPIISGTYYNNSDLIISLNLTNRSSGTKIDYTVETEIGTCNITVLFVPTTEVGRVMYLYKNSILKYNPRSFITLSEGSINDGIKNTILDKDTNEFALFNNGITMLSSDTNINERIGQRDRAQLYLKNPQIINGGQTAYTLSLIYEEGIRNNSEYLRKLDSKEVLIKIITINEENRISEENRKNLINSISEATNKQNIVNNADRHSNNELLIKSQQILFNEYGILLERKRGEFYDGLRYGYISKSSIIDRTIFLKIATASLGFPVPIKKETKLYKKENIEAILNENNNFRLYFFGCLCYSNIISTNRIHEEIGTAKKEGIYAVISLCSTKYKESYTDDELIDLAKNTVDAYISNWSEFEKYAVSKFHNSTYFKHNFNYRNKNVQIITNFYQYYKSNNLAIDLNDFFNECETVLNEEKNARKNLLTLEKYMSKQFITVDIIKIVQPSIPLDNWYDSTFKDFIIRNYRLSTQSVNNTIKLITSKEFGFYIKQIYEKTDN